MTADVIEIARNGLGGVLIVFGLALMLGGSVGVLRFPDFYTRLHAARVADGAGAVLVLLGLAAMADTFALGVRVVVLAVLVGAIAPTLAHLAANAAHTGGLAPLSGRYRAPRPGETRRSGGA